jgi:hypothetical protein
MWFFVAVKEKTVLDERSAPQITDADDKLIKIQLRLHFACRSFCIPIIINLGYSNMFMEQRMLFQELNGNGIGQIYINVHKCTI